MKKGVKATFDHSCCRARCNTQPYKYIFWPLQKEAREKGRGETGSEYKFRASQAHTKAGRFFAPFFAYPPLSAFCGFLSSPSCPSIRLKKEEKRAIHFLLFLPSFPLMLFASPMKEQRNGGRGGGGPLENR